MDGFRCSEGWAPETPMFIERDDRRIALGCYPGLIGRPEFLHAVKDARNVHGYLALNEYLLRSNLPDAHQRVRILFCK